ncbi:hypothetical protein FGRMN_8467 [Fusarium graminum]|nr:hypothetical protein FGRMN_8467 [Fusarium graminum]
MASEKSKSRSSKHYKSHKSEHGKTVEAGTKTESKGTKSEKEKKKKPLSIAMLLAGTSWIPQHAKKDPHKHKHKHRTYRTTMFRATSTGTAASVSIPKIFAGASTSGVIGPWSAKSSASIPKFLISKTAVAYGTKQR